MSESIRAIRYPFTVDAGLSELAVEPDQTAHVKQMILQVLFTAPGERINRPTFGCGVRRMVFAPLSDASANLAQVTILEALNTWMASLIKTDKVDVQFKDERMDPEKNPMPFDGTRLIYGGFEPIVEL